jgi:hypothetical protein
MRKKPRMNGAPGVCAASDGWVKQVPCGNGKKEKQMQGQTQIPFGNDNKKAS